MSRNALKIEERRQEVMVADAPTEVAREDAAEGRRMAPIHFLDFELVGQSRSSVR